MRTIKSLLLFSISCLLLYACKKDKGDAAPPAPLAVYKFDNDYLNNSMSALLGGNLVGNAVSSTDSFNVQWGCLSLSGDGYVEVKDSDLIDFPGNQFTISVWIRPTITSVAYLVVKTEDVNTNTPYCLDFYNGVVRAFVRTNTKEQFLIEGTTPIKAGVWQHLAATFTGSQLVIYYNGKKEGSKAVDRPLAVSFGDLAIGASKKYFPTAAFEGRIDNVKLFDKALSDGQVNSLYKSYKD